MYYLYLYQILHKNDNELSLDITGRQVVFMIEIVLY